MSLVRGSSTLKFFGVAIFAPRLWPHSREAGRFRTTRRLSVSDRLDLADGRCWIEPNRVYVILGFKWTEHRIVAGLYEAPMDRPATRTQRGHVIRPEIVASTATVRWAEVQIKARFNRRDNQVSQPPEPARSVTTRAAMV